MNSISSFKYGSEQYSFRVSLLDGRYGREYTTGLGTGGDTDYRFSKTLPNTNIKKINLKSTLIDPILRANIVFSDNERESMLNTFNNLSLFCTIEINSSPVKGSSALLSDDFGQSFKFSHTFYVNDIKILNKVNDIVSYSIDLISILFFPFMQTIPITTHTKQGSVYSDTMKFSQIVKSIFSGTDSSASNKFAQNELSLKPTEKDTDVEIEHMSPAGESRLSSLMSILSKNVISPVSDLVFIPFDHMQNQHEMWFRSDFLSSRGISDYETYRNIIDLIGSTGVEGLELISSDIKAVQSRSIAKNEDVIKNLSDTIEHSYDYNSRRFAKKPTIQSQTIQQGFGPKFSFDYSLLREGDNNQVFEGIDPDGLNFYNRMVNSLIKNNVVTVKTPGRLPRKPGIDMFIKIQGRNDATPLRDLIGRWLVTSIEHEFILEDEEYFNIMTLSSDATRDDYSTNRGIA